MAASLTDPGSGAKCDRLHSLHVGRDQELVDLTVDERCQRILRADDSETASTVRAHRRGRLSHDPIRSLSFSIPRPSASSTSAAAACASTRI